ncbi:MAG: hypothetical protein LLG37_05100 [Spirochaetia bacterium]|nr:hypothetical protein [Spirochaetia bacterium]
MLLNSPDVTVDGKMTNAGALFFAKKPKHFFPNSVFTRVPGKDGYKKRIRRGCGAIAAPMPEIKIEANYFYITFKPGREYLELAGIPPPVNVMGLTVPQAGIPDMRRDTVKEYPGKLKDKQRLKGADAQAAVIGR